MLPPGNHATNRHTVGQWHYRGCFSVTFRRSHMHHGTVHLCRFASSCCVYVAYMSNVFCAAAAVVLLFILHHRSRVVLSVVLLLRASPPGRRVTASAATCWSPRANGWRRPRRQQQWTWQHWESLEQQQQQLRQQVKQQQEAKRCKKAAGAAAGSFESRCFVWLSCTGRLRGGGVTAS